MPDATILHNEVPKEWADKQIYMQMIRNDDAGAGCYDMVPRGGAFEVSTVTKKGDYSQDILLYSKIIGGMWPHCGDLAAKIARYWEDKQAGMHPN